MARNDSEDEDSLWQQLKARQNRKSVALLQEEEPPWLTVEVQASHKVEQELFSQSELEAIVKVEEDARMQAEAWQRAEEACLQSALEAKRRAEEMSRLQAETEVQWKAETLEVEAETGSLEQLQEQVHADESHLVHSQMQILMQEMGDLQKHVLRLSQKQDEDLKAWETRFNGMQTSVEAAQHEAHAALRLELAKHDEKHARALDACILEQTRSLSTQAETHRATMAEMQAQLWDDLQKSVDKHTRTLAATNDEHQGKHARNAEPFEAGLQNALESAYSKLWAELLELRSGIDVKHSGLVDNLADATQQVGSFAMALEKEHQSRIAMETNFQTMCEQLCTDLQTSFQSKMAAMNTEHHEKHAQLAERLESGFQDVLGDSHTKLVFKLQEELLLLKSGRTGSLSDFSKVLTQQVAELQEELRLIRSGNTGSLADLSRVMGDVTRQVDDLEQTVQTKHELLEKRLSGIRTNTEVAQQEAQEALRLELAEHGERHGRALDERTLAHTKALASLSETHRTTTAEMEARLRDDLQKSADEHTRNLDCVNNEHHEKHARNAEALEAGLQNVLEAVVSKLRVELLELRSGADVKHSSLIDNLADVTLQVGTFNVALEKERQLRMAMEANFDTSCEQLRADLQTSFQGKVAAMNSEHHEKHAQLAERLETTIQDVLGGSHAKLQDELRLMKSGSRGSLADLSKVMGDVTRQVDDLEQTVQMKHELLEKRVSGIRTNTEVAQQEAHAALRLELAEHGERHARALDEHTLAHNRALASHADTHRTTIAEMEARLRDDLQKISDRHARNLDYVNDEQREKHARNVEALEAGLQNGLEAAGSKLRAQLLELRSGIDVKHSSLVDNLADVTQQVGTFTVALEKEHQSRIAMEINFDTICEQLRADLQTFFQDRMAAMSSDYYEKHAQIAERVETAIQDVLGDSHAKLQEELRLIKSGNTGSLADLSRVMGDVTRQVDDLEQTVQTKHELLEKRLSGIRSNTEVAQQEAHAALRLELAEHGERHGRALDEHSFSQTRALAVHAETHKATLIEMETRQKELRTALEESYDIYVALKSELAEHRKHSEEIQAAMNDASGNAARDLVDRLESHAQAHNASLAELERQLRSDHMMLATAAQSRHKDLEEMTDRQRQDHDALGQRMSLLDSSWSNRHDEAFRELQLAHEKIQGHRASVDERMDALERQLHEKIYPSLENRLNKMEATYSDVADKHAVDVEKAYAMVREALSKLDMQWEKHQQDKAIVEKRLQFLDKAVLEQVDANAQTLSQVRSTFHNEHDKEVTRLLQTERAAREVQEKTFLSHIADARKTFLDHIADARRQMEELEATVQEQLRLHSTAREMQHHFASISGHSDVVLQDRQRNLERRLEAFELSMQAERRELSQEMKHIWDAYGGLSHGAPHAAPVRVLTTMVREVSQPHAMVREVSPPHAMVREVSPPHAMVREVSSPRRYLSMTHH